MKIQGDRKIEGAAARCLRVHTPSRSDIKIPHEEKIEKEEERTLTR